MAKTRKQAADETPTTTKPPLSEGWKWFRFDEIAVNVNDRIDDPSKAGVEHYVGLDHLDSDSLKIRRWGTPDEVEAQKLRFRKGDIIFGKRRAYQRKLGVADFDGICSAHALVLRANPKNIAPDLLPFFMQTDTFMQRAIAISKGSLSPTINWPDLAKQTFALPANTADQRRIAELLTASFYVVECRAMVLTLLINSRRQVVDELLPASNSNLSTTLEAVCSMQNGRPYPSSDYADEGVRLLRPGNLCADGRLDWAPDITKCLPSRYLTEALDFRVGGNEVVINLTAQSLEDAFVGRVCLTTENDDCLLNQRIGRFYCQDGLLPEYLYRCLQTTRFRRLVESRCVGSKIKHLYWRHFKDFQIPLPSIESQQGIVDKLRLLERTIEDVNRSVRESTCLAQQLVKSSLTTQV